MKFANAIALGIVMLSTAERPAQAAMKSDPLFIYHWNSIVCQNQVTKAVCHLWLNADDRYVLVYDLGMQDRPLEIAGPYRIEAREGRFSVKRSADEFEVCLKPDAPPPGKVYVSEKRQELYAAAGCYALAKHNIGDTWMTDNPAGQANKMWLVSGR